MPSYTFKCNSCENTFDVICKVSEMDKQTCPNCSSGDYQSHITSPINLGDPVRLGIRGTDSGFKEVLSKIASANYKSNLTDKLSRK